MLFKFFTNNEEGDYTPENDNTEQGNLLTNFTILLNFLEKFVAKQHAFVAPVL